MWRGKQYWSFDVDTLGIYLLLSMSKSEVFEGAPSADVSLKVDLAASPDEKGLLRDHFTFKGWGWGNFFEKPWAEAVGEGSPHFPNGKLTVKVKVKRATK